MRSLLSDRIQAGTAATGTPTVTLSTLTDLNTDLASASKDDTLAMAVEMYTLLADVQDDIDSLSLSNAQLFLDGLTTLRGRADVGMYFRCEEMGDSPREDRIYELDVFERYLMVDYIRSD